MYKKSGRVIIARETVPATTAVLVFGIAVIVITVSVPFSVPTAVIFVIITVISRSSSIRLQLDEHIVCIPVVHIDSRGSLN